jgi:hypothetical protein
LRRLPWSRASVEDEMLLSGCSASEFDDLEELPRDQWPAR